MCMSLKATRFYDFSVPRKLWSTLSPNPSKTVDILHLEFVPDGKFKCLVKEKGTIVAVLLTGHRLVQVCGFAPADVKDRSGCGKKHEGRSLYEWAVVQRHSKNGTITSKFEIRTKSDGIFVIKKSNSNCIVKDSTTKQPVALLKKQAGATWRVRCCPGIDPAMMACMTVCLDKLKDLFEGEIRDSHQDLAFQRGFLGV